MRGQEPEVAEGRDEKVSTCSNCPHPAHGDRLCSVLDQGFYCCSCTGSVIAV